VIAELPLEAWSVFRADPTPAQRNRIVLAYMPLVHAIAKKAARLLPALVDVDDLVSAGCFGLIDAIATFDAARGVKFSTYASKRVHGAIIDYLRSLDEPGRTLRGRQVALAAATDAFRKAFGREPTMDELTASLGGGERAERILRDGNLPQESSLDARGGGDPGSRALADTIADRRETPIAAAAERDVRAFIARRLSRAEALLVTLYYAEHMTMREIGLTLGLSESRVSQMRTLLLERLRASLEGRDEDLG